MERTRMTSGAVQYDASHLEAAARRLGGGRLTIDSRGFTLWRDRSVWECEPVLSGSLNDLCAAIRKALLADCRYIEVVSTKDVDGHELHNVNFQRPNDTGTRYGHPQPDELSAHLAACAAMEGA